MLQKIKVPSIGESITEATVSEWVKKTGDFIQRDDILLVLETDKASVEIPAECDGVLTTKVSEGETVSIGAVLGEIDSKASPKPIPVNSEQKPSPSPASFKTPEKPSNNSLSPAVRRIQEEHNFPASQVTGTGPKGRVTKEDMLAQVSQKEKKKENPQGFPPLPQTSIESKEDVVREPMNQLRKTIAHRLVESQSTTASLTTFNEIDMSELISLRNQYKDKFKEKYKVSLGFMGFFLKATVEALKAFPRVNAFIEEDHIIYHNYYHVGVAVSTEKGLMVPVIRHANKLSLVEIEQAIKHYALKARDGQIQLSDLTGGTFTVSNGGVFGSLMSTPILNPPQSGILGMHKIEERPVAINGEVKIHPMMYVALTYDHRIIDGRESVNFLLRIKECIEDPTRILLEV